jgi:hypothetical protein
MSVNEVKGMLSGLLASDNAVPPDNILKEVYSAALTDALRNFEPLSLISRDSVNYKPFSFLDGVYFLRVPSEEETLREEWLKEALAYFMAARLASSERRSGFLRLAMEAAGGYAAALSAYLEGIGFQGRAGARDDIPILLESYGFEKHYDAEAHPSGARYTWREESVKALDEFMLKGGKLPLSLAAHYSDYAAWAERPEAINQADRGACSALDGIFLRRMHERYSIKPSVSEVNILSEGEFTSPERNLTE